MVDLAGCLSAAAAAGITGIAGIAAVIAGIAVAYIAVRRTEDGSEAAAGFRLRRGGEDIQREADIFKARTRIGRICKGSAAFRQASAQRIYDHIHRAIEFYDGEKPDGHIHGNGCAKGGIAGCGGGAAAGITAAGIAAAGAAGRIAQLCRQRNRLALCNGKRPAVGIAAAKELIGYGGHVGFGGDIPLCKKGKTLIFGHFVKKKYDEIYNHRESIN